MQPPPTGWGLHRPPRGTRLAIPHHASRIRIRPMSTPIQVTVWNEFRHEQNRTHPAHQVYPDGIHGAIAAGLREHPDLAVRTATLDEPEQGLPPTVLDTTDVLLWWGHAAHEVVRDELVTQVQSRVL